jgi:hypothetical protein
MDSKNVHEIENFVHGLKNIFVHGLENLFIVLKNSPRLKTCPHCSKK